MFSTPQDRLPDHADLLVVGAGAAGLYTAYRYLDANPEAHVVVLDRLNRPGGRLQSDLVTFDVDGQTVTVRDEEGGMRFNYPMTELMSLFKALGLCDEIVPFPMAPITGPNENRYSFRGRDFTVAYATAHPEIWGEIYDLDEDEKGQSPVALITAAYDTIYVHSRDALVEPLMASTGQTREEVEAYLTPDAPPKDPTPEYWQAFRIYGSWDGTPLYKWQLWGLLSACGYSNECVTMFAHTLGFEGPFWATTNAGEAIQILEDFPANPTYFTFEKGFSTLIEALVDEIEGSRRNRTGHGEIHLSANVDAIERDGDGFRVEVTRAPEFESAYPTVQGGVKATIAADRVVLALPRKALTTLFATSPALNHRRSEDPAAQAAADRLGQALLAANDQRLMKINLYFDHAWWQGLDVQYGPSFTDLPVNAVYPFYSLRGVAEDRAATAPPDPSLPAALTIYCDWNNTNFWQGLQSVGDLFDSPKQREHTDARPQVVFAASNAVVAQALALFRDLYPTDVPDPVLTSFRLWDGEQDFGYAYHQWDLDANDEGVIPLLAQPFDDAPIYICNEAYSDMQGWVNGSLRSANLVLGKLGIDPLDGGICSNAWTEDADAVAAPAGHGAGLWGVAVQADRSGD